MPRKAVLGATVLFLCVAQIVGIADCSGGIEKGHMIQTVPYTGSYQDGDGTFVRRDNVTHPYVFPLIRKCWWEYFTFQGEVFYTPWQQADGYFSCTNGSSCTISSANSSQQCYSSSSSVSHETAISIQGKYGGAEINAKVGTIKTMTTTTESCVTSTWTNGCSWTDGGCHFVCSQQQMAFFSGYKRYRCNFHAQPWQAKYDKTICMQDLDVTVPLKTTNFECGGNATPCDLIDPATSCGSPAFLANITPADATQLSPINSTVTILPQRSDASTRSMVVREGWPAVFAMLMLMLFVEMGAVFVF